MSDTDATTPGQGPEFTWTTEPYQRTDAEPASAASELPQDTWATPGPVPGRSSRRRAVAAALAFALVGAGIAATTADLWNRSAPAVVVAAPSVTRSNIVAAALPASQDGTPESATAAISPSVVTIAVSGAGGSGTGSGVVIRTDGFILTNNHVVEAAINGGTIDVLLADGRTLDATIVGTDATSDLAVVKVQPTSGLVAAVFADSDALRVGQAVLAVGAPLGLSNTVTQGIVSTLHRAVRTGDSSSQSVIDAVQTDASINPGNSGGALVDLAGHVVGINSAIATTSSGSGSIGVGFAIPSNDAAEVTDEIIASGSATHAQMGVNVGNSNTASRAGAVLASVTAGGAAADGGLRAGDIVTKVGDRPVVDADSLIVAVRANDPGDDVVITYRRDGQLLTTTVTLATAR